MPPILHLIHLETVEVIRIVVNNLVALGEVGRSWLNFNVSTPDKIHSLIVGLHISKVVLESLRNVYLKFVYGQI